MLSNGIIRPSYSPWNAPVMLVKKKNNSTRFVCDFRGVNEVTKRDTYPFPHIKDVITGADPAHFLTFSKVQNIKPHPKTTPKDYTQTIIIVLIIMPERSRTVEISKALYLQNQN